MTSKVKMSKFVKFVSDFATKWQSGSKILRELLKIVKRTIEQEDKFDIKIWDPKKIELYMRFVWTLGVFEKGFVVFSFWFLGWRATENLDYRVT